MITNVSEKTKIKVFGGEFKTMEVLHKEADEWIKQEGVKEKNRTENNTQAVCSITVFYE